MITAKLSKTRLTLLGLGGAAALLLAAAWPAAAAGLVGQCSDCHTMHNSEQGAAVARVGTAGTITATPIQNLLRMDCIACHAQGTGQRIATLPGGSTVPQVYHDDPEGDLAAGNYAYISGSKQGHGEPSSRKGHNVVDLVEQDDILTYPPGFRHAPPTSGMGDFDVSRFTCAGTMGCHGYRGQVLATSEVAPECNPEFEVCGEEGEAELVYRTGLSALSGYDGAGTSTTLKRGAHHNNYDGLKNVNQNPNFYDSPLAHSYRFIRSLRGYGNETNRWQNLNANSHNEYSGGYAATPLGDAIKGTEFGSTTSCSRCHVGGMNATDSRLTTPGQTMTGFCITCHGSFHSAGVTNGASGAFLRHPSDYVIKNAGEYAAYTVYSTTAPVARPLDFFVDGMGSSGEVRPGQDLVMCLSCHMAHASPYEGMLRFDYAALTSGMRAGDGNSIKAGEGCLACHTAKGGPMP